MTEPANPTPSEAPEPPDESALAQAPKQIHYVIDLSQLGGRRHEFGSGQELWAWANAEAELWLWLKNLASSLAVNGVQIQSDHAQIVGQVWAHQGSSVESLRDTAKALLDRPDPVPKLQARLVQFLLNVQQGRFIPRNTALFDFVQRIAKDSPVRASLVMAFLWGLQIPHSSAREFLEAQLDASLYLTARGTEWFEAQKSEAGQASQTWIQAAALAQATATALAGDRTTAQETLRLEKEALEGERNLRELNWKNWKQEQSKALQEWEDASKAKHELDLKAIRASVDQGLRLKKPVEQWHSTKKWFAGYAIGALVVTGICSVLPVWAAICWHKEIVRVLELSAIHEWVDYWRIGPVFLATFLYVWVIRLGVRIFLAFQQIATEAGLRARMSEMYLALIKEEGVTGTPESLRLLLDAMFRPIDTGLGGGDQAPPLPQTLIQNMVDRVPNK